MAMNFCLLALLTDASPLTDVFVDARPNKTFGDQMLSGTDSWV